MSAMMELSTDGKMKSDADMRPMWVCRDRRVFLETFNPYYAEACDFMIAISDPVCRANLVHEYQISSYSLYAAVSLGLTTEDIVTALDNFSKTELDPNLVDWIKDKTARCGRVRLVLKRTRFFLETIHAEHMDTLMTFDDIYESRIDNRVLRRQDEDDPLGLSNLTSRRSRGINASIQAVQQASKALTTQHDKETGYLISVADDAPIELDLGNEKNNITLDAKQAMGITTKSTQSQAQQPKQKVYMIEIDPRKIEKVRRVCKEKDFPLLEEYDFKHDEELAPLPIKLKPSTTVRDYQQKSLSKMFGNGRARSGIIVLPCGAGKTLVGVTAAQTIKKSTLVFCTSTVAVEQWRNQFMLWTNLDSKYIYEFTADKKKYDFNSTCLVMITTYNMFAAGGKRAEDSQATLNFIKTHPWGLLVLDEVQVAPAKTFRKVMSETKCKTKLGLTATLIREDDKIQDLQYMLGPKLYEANWMDLQRRGYIATVQCVQVWCPMSAEFYAAYLQSHQSHNRQRQLYVNNPNKFRACQYLIALHEQLGDKILVFSDNVWALEVYATSLQKPYIHGGTSNDERRKFLKRFQTDPKINTLFISKIGDNSIDLPDVNVIIQISSHYSSRRQEAQRLGRILRPKSKSTGRFNAFFYTLISMDTREMKYAFKRQRFLSEQGYAFKIVKDIMEVAIRDPEIYSQLKFQTIAESELLLQKIRESAEEAGELEKEPDQDVYRESSGADKKKKRKEASASSSSSSSILNAALQRGPTSDVSSLTGGTGLYAEFDRKQGNSSSMGHDQMISQDYEPIAFSHTKKKRKTVPKSARSQLPIFKKMRKDKEDTNDFIRGLRAEEE